MEKKKKKKQEKRWLHHPKRGEKSFLLPRGEHVNLERITLEEEERKSVDGRRNKQSKENFIYPPFSYKPQAPTNRISPSPFSWECVYLEN